MPPRAELRSSPATDVVLERHDRAGAAGVADMHSLDVFLETESANEVGTRIRWPTRSVTASISGTADAGRLRALPQNSLMNSTRT